MEPGDVVYSRGRVPQATTTGLAPESAPLLVDEAPFPRAE
jgi:hypothetical protein